MLSKLVKKFERAQVSLASLLLRRIARAQATSGKASDNVALKLYPNWNELVASSGTGSDPELRAAARTLLLGQLPAEAWSLIPSLEVRAAPVMSTWTYQNEAMTWDIGQGDLVLDVGSGGWPFKRANHLADKFPEETSHRVETMVRDERPFFEVDLEKLPFEDRAYDFVFCSHVLEHLDNPGQAMRELMRVARRGYIEVPTRLSDVMFNFTRLQNHHRWHSLRQGNTLLLIEWNERERRELGNQFFTALHSEYSNNFQDFFERNRDLFFTSYSWDEKIEFLIIDKDGREFDSSYGSS
ncbi:class I SAM-dependent methyltransferase [Rhizobium laguerreae]|uniref:class I SAM-dependent methyltransferase n=1 Tax=Rhizobium laguerreae TaxID=1076926 RepID=UPI001039FEFE|nr:class I SAM-dependent methyltransferase [Rhizobium laguerreae]TBX75222.1 class I SAM-dependent methyltransferase [Rhizobium laguerreae]TBY08422.1 class I SAM-dependent methyltransferase [Rhizobium laguerreae]